MSPKTVKLKNLSAGCYAQGMTQWFYHTEHSRADIAHKAYWNDALGVQRDSGLMQAGDLIYIRFSDVMLDTIGVGLYAINPDGKAVEMQYLAFV